MIPVKEAHKTKSRYRLMLALLDKYSIIHLSLAHLAPSGLYHL